MMSNDPVPGVKRPLRQGVCLLVCLLLCFLAACAQKTPQPPALSYAQLLAMMNRSVETELGQVVHARYWTARQDRLWAVGMTPGEYEDPLARPLCIASGKADGTDLTSMALPVAFDEALQAQQTALAAEHPQNTCHAAKDPLYLFFDEDDGPHILLYESLTELDGGSVTIPAEQYTLCAVGADGALTRGPVVAMPEGNGWLLSGRQCLYAGQNQLWLHWQQMDWATGQQIQDLYQRIDCLSGSQTAAVSLPQGHAAWHQCLLPDGDILLFTQYDTGTGVSSYHFFTIGDAADSPTLSAAQPFPDGMTDVLFFADALSPQPQQPLLLYNFFTLYQYDRQQNQAQPLLRWEEYGLDGTDIQQIFALSDSQFLVIQNDGAFHLLTLTNGDVMAGQPTVTFALTDSSYNRQLQDAVAAYNAQMPDKYIQIVDYTYDTAQKQGFDSGEDMLRQDILHDTAPDIVLLPSGMNGQNLIRQGFFVDLYPYLDADPELKREDFVQSVLLASEYDGTLPTIIPAYSVLTAAGSTQLVGETPGWDWAQYDALCAQYPDAAPFYAFDRDTILYYLLQMGGSRYIDYATGQAHLDTDSFARLLTAGAAYPATAGDPAADPKQALTSHQALLQVNFLYDWRQLLTQQYAFDGTVTFKGFPSEEGGGSAFTPALRLGISQYCTDPQAAWDFVRTLLQPAFLQSLPRNFPLRQDMLVQAATAAQQPDENAGIPLYLSDADLTDSQRQAFTRGLTVAETDQILVLIENTHTLYWYDSVVADILAEEADAYYNGIRTAAEAAQVIQDRVQTYLNE